MGDDIHLLLNALENSENEHIFSKTSKELHEIKVRSLLELELPENVTIDLLTQLKEYIHVDEIPDIKMGSFIKWIPLSNPDKIKLTNGAIVCDIIISENGTLIKCKNFRNTFIMVNLEKSLIYRKLTNQEKILISVSNYLNKE